MPIGDFLESSSQAMLVGTMLGAPPFDEYPRFGVADPLYMYVCIYIYIIIYIYIYIYVHIHIY